MRRDPLQPIPRTASVRTRVYATLRQAIIQGALPDGTALVSTELSARLGVSRTPVREAIVRLVQDGLAVETDGGQVIVRPVSREELRSFFEIRAELERLAARRFAGRRTPALLRRLDETGRRIEEAVAEGQGPARQVELNERFHAVLYEGSGNVLLERAIHDLEAMTARRVIARLYQRADPQTTIREHRAIVVAIERGDEETAAHEAGAHVERACEYLLQFFEELTESPSETDGGNRSAPPRRDG